MSYSCSVAPKNLLFEAKKGSKKPKNLQKICGSKKPPKHIFYEKKFFFNFWRPVARPRGAQIEKFLQQGLASMEGSVLRKKMRKNLKIIVIPVIPYYSNTSCCFASVSASVAPICGARISRPIHRADYFQTILQTILVVIAVSLSAIWSDEVGTKRGREANFPLTISSVLCC